MAAVAADAVPARFDIGRVVTRAFEVCGANIISFFALATLIEVPQLALERLLVIPVLEPHGLDLSAGIWSVVTRIGVMFAAATVLSCILQAALVHGAAATLSGKSAGLMECLATSFVALPKLAGIAFIGTVLVIVGFVLLVVPGLVIMMMLYVSVPVCLVENRSILGSLSRSRELTRSHRWVIFGLFAVLYLVSEVVEIALQPLAGVSFLPASSSPLFSNSAYLVAQAVTTIILAAVGGVLAASIYYELRTIKEGIGPEQLAAVFA